jgi:signal transduction histidine kinase
MLIPAYAFVSRMVLPLQKINEVAMEYGKGNFSVRADESHKGEIGELGQSFNFLADRLSKSISDLTAERNQLQDIFDVISDGIVVVDKNSVPVTTNKAIHKLF